MKTFNYLQVLDIEDIFNTLNFTFNTVNQATDNFRYNFSKDDENYFIELAVPSYEKDDINIDFENHELIISSTINENWKKEFKKVFKIKQDIDSENISAALEKGILKIVLPRTETSKSRKIKIK